MYYECLEITTDVSHISPTHSWVEVDDPTNPSLFCDGCLGSFDNCALNSVMHTVQTL